MKQLHPFRRVSLTEDVVAELYALIQENHLGPGHRLPAEGELARQLNISRPSLREALRLMEAMGVIEKRHGVGVFVKQPSAATAPRKRFYRGKDLDEIRTLVHDVRMMLECYAAALASRTAKKNDLEQIEIAFEKYENAMVNDNVSEAIEADIEFHWEVFRATKNMALLDLVEGLVPIISADRMQTLPYYRGSAKLSEGHRQILSAIKNHEPDKAAKEMERHLEAVQRDLRGRRSTAPQIRPFQNGRKTKKLKDK